ARKTTGWLPITASSRVTIFSIISGWIGTLGIASSMILAISGPLNSALGMMLPLSTLTIGPCRSIFSSRCCGVFYRRRGGNLYLPTDNSVRLPVGSSYQSRRAYEIVKFDHRLPLGGLGL